MSSRRPRLAWLLALALGGSACNLIFGVHDGEPGEGGSLPDGGLPDGDPGDGEVADAPPDHADASEGGTCTAGTASCNGGTLTVCDGSGQPQALDCHAIAACDPIGKRCLTAADERLSVGHGRGCVIDDARAVLCWGDNGALLEGANDMLPEATPMPGVSPARQVSAGAGTQCVLRDDGKVICWGGNDSGEAGQTMSSFADPGLVGLPAPALEVRTAERCTCARLNTGEVRCWGELSSGCFGDGGKGDGPQVTPLAVGGIDDAVELHPGTYWQPFCVRRASGKVTCWSPEVLPSDVPGVTDPVEVATGVRSIFVRTADGTVLFSHDGGSGAWTPAAPFQVPHPSAVVAIRAGRSFCALHQDGAVSCTPIDDNGPAGTPSLVDTSQSGTAVEIAVGAGDEYGSDLQCLRGGGPISGKVWCWGDDMDGALGAGAPHVVKMPAKLAGLSGLTALAPAESSTAGVASDGRVWVWGYAPGLRNVTSNVPATAAALGNNVAFVAHDPGDPRAALIRTDGSLSMLEYAVPMSGTARLLQAATTGYKWVKLNYHWDIGLLADGHVVVYGDGDTANAAGIFGDTTTTCVAAGQAAQVPSLANVTKLAAYGDTYNTAVAHACAVVGSPGELWCWGDNGYSELTGAPTNAVTSPIKITMPGNEAILDVATGYAHTCAVVSGGLVYCWGRNDYGQLGYATSDPNGYPQPDLVTGVSGAVSIAASYGHTCVVLADQRVMCWGVNDRAQLGDDTFDNRGQAQLVPGLTGVAEIGAASDTTCARHTDGAVSCWGSSYAGQVGTGVTGRFPEPRQVQGL